MMNNISKIKNMCFGCRGCEQVCPKSCIKISSSNEGFLYPHVNEDMCIGCGWCLKVCPAQHTNIHRNKPQKVYAFKNKNNEEIIHSASGGAAHIATKVILEQHGVVYGAAYNEDFLVRHIEVVDGVLKNKLQSSKYVQSDIGDCYSKAKMALSNGQKVLFTGTPCQIAGLYTFLGGDNPNLYTLDLICHGVPSPKFFKKYLEYQRYRMGDDITYYNFRSKEKRGWGTQYLIKTKTKSKTNVLSLDKYGKHFLIGDCYRESCYHCPYANLQRVGDITVGDFWGIQKSHPDFHAFNGVSCVLINSKKGHTLFEKMKTMSETKEVSITQILSKQGNLKAPSKRPKDRDNFYKNINEDYFISSIKIGMQINSRLKSLMPFKLVELLKRYN